MVSLDADFLSTGPGRLRYTRDFTARRKVRGNQHEMNRLYVVESTPSNTGAMADHRLPLRAAEIEAFTLALAAEVGVAWPLPAPPATAGFGLDSTVSALTSSVIRALAWSLPANSSLPWCTHWPTR